MLNKKELLCKIELFDRTQKVYICDSPGDYKLYGEIYLENLPEAIAYANNAEGVEKVRIVGPRSYNYYNEFVEDILSSLARDYDKNNIEINWIDED